MNQEERIERVEEDIKDLTRAIRELDIYDVIEDKLDNVNSNLQNLNETLQQISSDLTHLVIKGVTKK